MTRRHTIVAIVVVLSSLVVQIGLAAEFRPISKGPTTVENFLDELFLLTHSSGSLILRGTCKVTNVTNGVASDDLPNPPQGPFQNLDEALNAVSKLNPHLSWSRDANGLTRVRDDRVPTDVLRLRLQRVHFNRVRDSNAAIRIVLDAPEVQAYFRENDIERSTSFNASMYTTPRGFPTSSGDLRNVTVAEALDRIMRFFPGLWMYNECENGPLKRVMVDGFEVGSPASAPADGRPTPQ
jgi:hypothetical protein